MLFAGMLAACASRAVPARVLAWEQAIQAFERADKLAPPPKGGTVFIGSSSIRLWKTLSEDFPGRAVVNRGFGGAHTEDVTHYAGRILLPLRPRCVVLYAGDNDIAAGKTPKRVLEDFKRFVAAFRAELPDARIVYLSIKPSPSRWRFAREMRTANALIAEHIRGKNGLRYADVFGPMLGADGKPAPGLYAEDGLHLSPEGYALWRKSVAPHLN